uniref:NECAP PHear domain-containing protein n=1 Tax=Fagus sylvatica TaxID=28930 RepID=A0A2N9IY69_FAGSY
MRLFYALFLFLCLFSLPLLSALCLCSLPSHPSHLDKIWAGRLRVVSCKARCEIRLEDPGSGDLFAECFVQPDQPREAAVETVLHSSRYFVLRIEDGRGKHAFVGLGFVERNEDLWVWDSRSETRICGFGWLEDLWSAVGCCGFVVRGFA